MSTQGLPPLFGFPWERHDPNASDEYRLAATLWLLVLEGGDAAGRPHYLKARDGAVSLLEELGYYKKGKGFIRR